MRRLGGSRDEAGRYFFRFLVDFFGFGAASSRAVILTSSLQPLGVVDLILDQ